MKTITLSIVGIMMFTLSYSQILDRNFKEGDDDSEIKTLLGPDRSNGGYGGFYVNYSEIDNKDAIVIGGRGSWIIGHSFALGIGGAGFINDFHYENDYKVNLTGGYGGLVMEPILLPKFPVHLAVPVLVGMGGIAYSTHSPDLMDYYIEDSEAYLVIEPGIELEFNLTRFFRLGFGIYYRYTSDILFDESFEVMEDVLHGLSGGIIFKFGKF